MRPHHMRVRVSARFSGCTEHDEAVESGISITLYEFEDEAQVVDNFMAGLCDIVATDGTGRILAQVPSGQEWDK